MLMTLESSMMVVVVHLALSQHILLLAATTALFIAKHQLQIGQWHFIAEYPQS